MYKVVRTSEQIDDLLDECVASVEVGHSEFPGKSYEEGIQNAINWVLDRQYQRPIGTEEAEEEYDVDEEDGFDSESTDF